ncbi:DUF2850 domain-containing protein [uncultured Photobacterium sp.]|uniref:DUF2850 domain-containing protein n=1 Tax=uncultured Photobacterium sp. TaxID=173973 RepID=UPI00260DA700|nr:DUF2850 domain-containing protein [uncultured Photobacterium sp.]
MKLQFAFVVGGTLVGFFFSAMIAVGAIDTETFGGKPLPNINGTWVEKEVAPYVADSFELRQEGVFVDGRLVTTRYDWDGNILKYRLGDDIYVYKLHEGRLMRQQPAHYISSFARKKEPEHCLAQNCT